MEYWLADGKAPQGLTGGLRLLPVDLASLRAEQLQGQWCLRDGRRVLFNFGLKAEDARQGLAVARKYGFTQLGVLGQARPSMLVFLARPGDGSPASRPSLANATPRAPDKGQSAVAAAAPGTTTTTVTGPPLTPAATLTGIVTPAVPPLRTAASAGAVPGLTDPAARVPFDWRQVQVRLEKNEWVLQAGSQVLGRFGANERDARVAQATIQYYRLNELRQVGQPTPKFTYFLANGQAPRGVMVGLRNEAFQPDRLEVRQVGGRWTVCAGEQPVVRLGDRPEEARQMLDVIRTNKFDHVCHVGGDDQGLTLLVRSR
jgi:hypothetical protein